MKRIKNLSGVQKKDQLIIALLSLAVVALLVFCVNAFKTETAPAVEMPATTAYQSEVVSTTVQSADLVTTVVTEPSETQAPQTQPSETTTAAPVDETEEILKVVSDSVNYLKSDKANFTGHKVQNINIHLVDSSVPAVNDIINGVISAFIKEEILDYDFTNGISPDPEGEGTVNGNGTFPPGDKPFELTKDGVAKATKEKTGDNTVYTIVIVPETSTLENPRPPHHNSAADTLDLSSVKIPIITLTKVDFSYSGATVSVTLNSDGEIVGYYEKLPISGTGEGYGLGITGYGTIEGYLEENWDIVMK